MKIHSDSVEIYPSYGNAVKVCVTNLKEIRFDNRNWYEETAIILHEIGIDRVKEYFGLE